MPLKKLCVRKRVVICLIALPRPQLVLILEPEVAIRNEGMRSTNTVADAGDGGCYLVWGCWSSEPRDARLKILASSRC